MIQPSPVLGLRRAWNSKNNVHNPMFDGRGPVWITSAVRPPDNPDYCKQGFVPLCESCFRFRACQPAPRHVRPEDGQAHAHQHLFRDAPPDVRRGREQHAVDERRRRQCRRLADTKKFEETGDEQKSQGWTALILDTNGNGKRDAYVEPNEPVDPTKDKRDGADVLFGRTGADGSIWGSVLGYPGAVRFVPGANPPETALAEVYEPPFNDPDQPRLLAARYGHRPRRRRLGRARERAHRGSFDRRKCKGPLNGPKATGQHCPEDGLMPSPCRS